MHKSRLSTLVIDCQSDDDQFDEHATFWSKALNYDILRRYQPGDENYRGLKGPTDQPKMLIQKVQHPSCVHLDIETDDIEAEVLRLEDLGAKRVQKVNYWWVMEAPSGHRFCVVQTQRKDFQEKANTWD